MGKSRWFFLHLCSFPAPGIMGGRKRGESMRLAGMISLILVLSLLTGSSPWLLPQAGAAGPVEDTPGAEKLLARQEEKLLAYEAELLQAAEELLSAKAGEIRREQAQELHDAAADLRKELQDTAAQGQRELEQELLGLQLELVFVTLTPEEQEAKLKDIEALQEELRLYQEELEEEFQTRLQDLQAEHESLAQKRLEAFHRELDQAVREELAAYRQQLLVELDGQLSRALANGPY